MNALTEQPKKADEDTDRKAKSVAQRKAEAKALRPVRNDPQAATSTGDFVKLDEEIEDLGPEDDEAEYDEDDNSPEAVNARKNAAADAKREAAKAAKGATPAKVTPAKTK